MPLLAIDAEGNQIAPRPRPEPGRTDRAARAQALASEESRRGVTLSLIANVAQAYFELLELDRLREHGIDPDVFERARQPFLRSREEDLRTNSYWGHTVLRDAQLRPARLAAARDHTADTAAITRAELEELARRYLDPARGFLFIAEPGPTETWGAKYLWDAR